MLWRIALVSLALMATAAEGYVGYVRSRVKPAFVVQGHPYYTFDDADKYRLVKLNQMAQGYVDAIAPLISNEQRRKEFIGGLNPNELVEERRRMEAEASQRIGVAVVFTGLSDGAYWTRR